MLVGQVGLSIRTVPLVLHRTDGIGWTNMLVGQVGLSIRTVPLVLHRTDGIGRTHSIKCV